MLNDADASRFKKVYLAMGFTDLRRGSMDWQQSYAFSLNLIPMIKIPCFYSAEEDTTGSRHCSGKGMDFSSCIKDLTAVHSGGRVLQMRQWQSQKNNTAC